LALGGGGGGGGKKPPHCLEYERVLKIFYFNLFFEYRQIWLNILTDDYHLKVKQHHKIPRKLFFKIIKIKKIFFKKKEKSHW
jgi:hypothetical protein